MHQAAVAGRPSRMAFVVTGSDGGQLRAIRGLDQDPSGLDADVLLVAVEPVEEAVADGGGVSRAGRRLLGDADGHLGVVGPLALGP